MSRVSFSRNRSVLLVLLVALGGFVGGLFSLHRMGANYHWSKFEYSDGVEEFETIDDAVLTEGGEWLLWTDHQTGVVSVFHLENPGDISRFHTFSHLQLKPVGVIAGHLFVLRTSLDRGWFDQVRFGFESLFGEETTGEGRSEVSASIGKMCTVHLEGLNLETGELITRAPGTTGLVTEAEQGVPGFQVGRVALDPDHRSAAWWWAREEVQGTPVAATVTENMSTYSFTEVLEPTFDGHLATPGYFQVWSGMLSQIGKPLWTDADTCLFLSFLDSGSLVPVDTRAGEFAATITIGEMFQQAKPADEKGPLLPEGVCTVPLPASSEVGLLWWRRSMDSIEFLQFDGSFQYRSSITYEIGDLDLSDPMWIFGGRLLVREREGGAYIALSGIEEGTQKFPPSPLTEEGFEILGSEKNGDLVALFDSKFWTAAEGAETWSELEVSP